MGVRPKQRGVILLHAEIDARRRLWSGGSWHRHNFIDSDRDASDKPPSHHPRGWNSPRSTVIEQWRRMNYRRVGFECRCTGNNESSKCLCRIGCTDPSRRDRAWPPIGPERGWRTLGPPLHRTWVGGRLEGSRWRGRSRRDAEDSGQSGERRLLRHKSGIFRISWSREQLSTLTIGLKR